ncbi:Vancomycin resistance protein YoaR OS=Ureibacillus acetophenoni OX=614649 GN=SAMN05877842_10479 PE=4 SV=1 [Ureibacillus acetophenoni]
MKMFTLVVLGLFLLYLWLPTTDIMRVFADDKSNGSTIAGVNVEGLDQKEIENVLLEAINTWLQEDITVTGGGIELTIDPSKLQYDIPSTINEFETLSKKPWYAFWESERVIHIPLKLEDNLDIKNEVATVGAWETDETYNQIMSQALFLMDHTVEAKVKDLDIFNTVRLALSIREIPSSAFAPIELVTLLDGKMINPGEEFSFIEAVKDGSDKVNSESLNFVSSLLYEAVLQTEFEILERHNGIAIPASIELGKEAIINTNFNEDLKFINTTDYVGKINVSIEGNSMKLEISSNTKGKDVSVRVDKEILNPRIIYRYSSDLPVGQQQMLQEGRFLLK